MLTRLRRMPVNHDSFCYFEAGAAVTGNRVKWL